MILSPPIANKVVHATCILHNFLLDPTDAIYRRVVVDQQMPPRSRGIGRMIPGHGQNPWNGVVVHNDYKTYFMSAEGEVQWQYDEVM